MLVEGSFQEIGTIGKVIGARGHLKCFIHPEYHRAFIANDFIWLNIQGDVVPYRILEKKEEGEDQFQIVLNGKENREAARELTRSTIFLPWKDINHFPDQLKAERLGLEGFALYDLNLGFIGIINQLIEYPSQIILEVKDDNKSYLIPFHEELLQEIYMDKKRVEMDLPPGILKV